MISATPYSPVIGPALAQWVWHWEEKHLVRYDHEACILLLWQIYCPCVLIALSDLNRRCGCDE